MVLEKSIAPVLQLIYYFESLVCKAGYFILCMEHPVFCFPRLNIILSFGVQSRITHSFSSVSKEVHEFNFLYTMYSFCYWFFSWRT